MGYHLIMSLRKIISHVKQRVFNYSIVNMQGFKDWRNSDFPSPLPPQMKIKVLKRWGGVGTWVESGTYFGKTSHALSQFSNQVYTIEPDPKLHEAAAKKYGKISNIRFINGLSEEKLVEILDGLDYEEKKDISFWLDGHFSAGVTFKGPTDTPIIHELETIEREISKFEQVTVLVDDVRCFNPENPNYSSYPDLNYLVSWAQKLNLFWIIEYDMFIATNRKDRPYLKS